MSFKFLYLTGVELGDDQLELEDDGVELEFGDGSVCGEKFPKLLRFY